MKDTAYFGNPISRYQLQQTLPTYLPTYLTYRVPNSNMDRSIDRSQRPQRFLEIKLESVREQISFHFNNVPMYVGGYS